MRRCTATGFGYGIRSEAKANCYAAQLILVAAGLSGLAPTRAQYFQKLGMTHVRQHAPGDYWDTTACRDGGRWDLEPRRQNLG
jgi:hypothetical protein